MSGPQAADVDPDRYRLTDQENGRIFEARIVPALFASAKTHERPTAIVFGGQPGAGKSAATSAAVRELDNRGGSVMIEGDDFRRFHPRYADLLETSDSSAAFYTDRDSGRWVERSIARGIELRTNLVIEGTMRNPDVVARTLGQLRDAGYTTEARAVAIDDRRSWQGVLQRYEVQRANHGTGRMTAPEAHDAAYRNMPETIDRVEREGSADRVMLLRRGGQVIYDNERGSDGAWRQPPAARAALEGERSRPWTLDEHRDYAARFESLRDTARGRGHSGANDREVEQLAAQAGRGLDAAVIRELPADVGLPERPHLQAAYATLEAVLKRAAATGMTGTELERFDRLARAKIAVDLVDGRVPSGSTQSPEPQLPADQSARRDRGGPDR